MLNKLQELVYSDEFMNSLDEPELWNSLIINRRKPVTYRVFRQIGDYRVCLHKFEKCSQEEAFLHPHPWPAAFMLVSGSYKMNIGYSQSRLSPPSEVASFILNSGSSYEIVNPMTWHSVIPLEDTYTVMLNGAPWDIDYAHKDIRTTKGKDLESFSPSELEDFLFEFPL